MKEEKSLPTLGEFIIEKQRDFKYSTGELSRLISCIQIASKMVNRAINKAGIANILGAAGNENVQGEEQQKLDVIANETFIKSLSQREVVRITPEGTPVQLEDFLQKGIHQVAAGYIVYGSSTMLVYTTGKGVNGFTLDPSLGSYYLSHPDMKFPEKGKIYSINEGNYIKFPQGVKDYIKYCQEEKEDRPYTSRYIGSLVSDFHRNMIKGGIYMYPSTSQSPNGKLRLLYECNPMAFLTEQAGGKASDGFQRILEIEPSKLHQRTPFFCGSRAMVDTVEAFMRGEKK